MGLTASTNMQRWAPKGKDILREIFLLGWIALEAGTMTIVVF